MKIILYFFGALFFGAVCIQPVQAQDDCGTDPLHQKMMLSDSAYRAGFLKLQKDVLEIIKDNMLLPAKQQVYVVPVVVHVIHLGEPLGTGTNIPDTQIYRAIQGLNERFRGMLGLGADIEIEFCLAVRDPNGCPTSGINRVSGSGIWNYAANGISIGDDTCGAPPNEAAIKDLSRWPVLDYYNIWVVNKVCGGYGGYAYYPWGGIYDGTVVVYNAMTYSSKTPAHELGHGFNLFHTFRGDDGNVCPVDTNCLVDGDRCCDTPPHRTGDCGLTNPCPGAGLWDNSRYNYMSYCSGTNRFTVDQRDRMRASILVYPRANLLNSMGCVPPDFGTLVNATGVSCHGVCDGAITLNPSALCSPVYHYEWNTGDTTQTLAGLCAATYSVTISTPGFDTAKLDVIVPDAPAMLLSPLATDATCYGLSDGQVAVSVTGGTPFTCGTPFSFNIGTGSSLPANTAYPAPYGNYYWGAKHQILVRASELNAQGFTSGNIYSLALNVSSISGTAGYTDFHVQCATTSLTAITSFQPGLQSCFGPQNITISPGWNTHVFHTPFYWDGASNLIVQICFNNASATYNSSVFGTVTSYFSVVWDKQNSMNVCTGAAGSWMYGNLRPNLKFNSCNDSVHFQYLWSNGQTGTTVTGLAAGDFIITVTDANNCMEVDTLTIGQPDPLTATIVAHEDASCYGSGDGSATVAAGGGSPGYSYLWSNGQAGLTDTLIMAGIYTVTVTDSNHCADSASVIISQPLPLNVNISPQNVSCFGATDGSALATASGGTAGYIYSWSSGQNIALATGLQAGTYGITVLDTHNCMVQDSITITEPDALSIAFAARNVCYTCDGEATVFVSGGTAPYEYLWFDGTQTADIDSLCTGVFMITVTDTHNCVVTDSIGIIQLIPPVVTATAADDTICLGQVTQLFSSGADSSVWLPATGLNGSNIPDPLASPSQSTLYTLTGTDTNGCSDTATVLISVLPLPAISFTGINSDTLCIDYSPLVLSGNPSGGVFSGDGVGSGVFDPSAAGQGLALIIYSFTDSNGCMNTCTDSVFVSLCLSSPDVAISEPYQLDIYPNPFTGVLYIRGNGLPDGMCSISIVSVLGQTVEKYSFGILHHRLAKDIDLGGLPPGVYCCRLLSQGMNYSLKLVKK